MALSSYCPGCGGKLNAKSLYKLYVGQTKVFRRVFARTGLGTAAHLLVDVSGIMHGIIDLARLAAFSLCEALYEVPGINVANRFSEKRNP
jgi:cobalamin biosynthesis protein CobT